MHRKRLLKQIETTYDLFQTIHPQELDEVLKEYQDIDIKLDKKEDIIEGYTIYDKSGYVFRERELSPEHPNAKPFGYFRERQRTHGNRYRKQTVQIGNPKSDKRSIDHILSEIPETGRTAIGTYHDQEFWRYRSEPDGLKKP